MKARSTKGMLRMVPLLIALLGLSASFALVLIADVPEPQGTLMAEQSDFDPDGNPIYPECSEEPDLYKPCRVRQTGPQDVPVCPSDREPSQSDQERADTPPSERTPPEIGLNGYPIGTCREEWKIVIRQDRAPKQGPPTIDRPSTEAPY